MTNCYHSTGLRHLAIGGVAINEAIEVLKDLMRSHCSDLKSWSGHIKGLQVMLKLKELSVLFRKNIAPGGEISSARKEVRVSKKNN